jgi:hypothetical protein
MFVGGRGKFGGRAKFPYEDEEFFLKCCFWDFPLECHISNANLQSRQETQGYFPKLFCS